VSVIPPILPGPQKPSKLSIPARLTAPPADCKQVLFDAEVAGFRVIDRGLPSERESAWPSRSASAVQERLLDLAVALSGLPGVRRSHVESPQVVRYTPGRSFGPHHDNYCRGVGNVSMMNGEEGRRVATVIFYLTESHAGGETRFVNLGRSFWPALGSALIFHPLADDGTGRCHPLALHEGRAPTAGVKVVVTVWVHERPYAQWRDLGDMGGTNLGANASSFPPRRRYG
jgi:hypothetical protein